MDKQEWDKLQEESAKKHQIYWDFCKAIEEDYDDGYDSMLNIEKYVEEHPEIKICGCDDTSFSSSDLVLVPHPNMGVTVIYIPQNHGRSTEFFLYGGHIRGLINTLQEIEKEYLSEV